MKSESIFLEERICEKIFESLSAQEKSVAAWVWCGLRDKEAAASMGISIRTVRFHLKNVLKKTGCQSRVEIALMVERAKRPHLSLLPATVFFFQVPSWLQRILKTKLKK